MFKAEYSNLTEAREKIIPPNVFDDIVIEILTIWERFYWVKTYIAYYEPKKNLIANIWQIILLFSRNIWRILGLKIKWSMVLLFLIEINKFFQDFWNICNL